MIRFLADEDFNGRIVRGLLRRRSDLCLVRAQDVGLTGAHDDKILEWADRHNRLLLTHDARTMPTHVRIHLESGAHLPGIFIVDDLAAIGRCVDDIMLVAESSDEAEWRDKVIYLPLP